MDDLQQEKPTQVSAEPQGSLSSGFNNRQDYSTNQNQGFNVERSGGSRFNNSRGGDGGGYRGGGRGRGGAGRNSGYNGSNFRKRQFNDQGDYGASTQGYNNESGTRGGGNFGSKFYDRLMSLSQSTVDLPVLDSSERKFNGRNRFYIGNIANDCTEDDLKELFTSYGEVCEVFINKEKGFGFLRMDYRINAEKAKHELDGKLFKDKHIRIRFASPNSSIKVRNLPAFVTNELLHHAFSVFGEIERALVSVDEKGRPTGEGVVDFGRKGSAMHAIRQCKEAPFFLTASLRPCIVENYEHVDEVDGYSEKSLSKKNQEYLKMRSVGPHLAQADSFEFEFGSRYREAYELYDQKLKALKSELGMELEKIDAQMEYARYEFETEQLRKQLRQREIDHDMKKPNFNRPFQQSHLRQQQDNNPFMSPNQFGDTKSDNSFDQSSTFSACKQEPNQGFVEEPKAFLNNFNRGNNCGLDGSQNMGSGHQGGGGGHWVNNNESRREDIGFKRRRM